MDFAFSPFFPPSSDELRARFLRSEIANAMEVIKEET